MAKTKRTGGGPGTLEDRIGKLKSILDDKEVKQAEKLAKELPFKVLQYSYYIAERPAAVQAPKIGTRQLETLAILYGEGTKEYEAAKAKLLAAKRA
jgi:hypothetical protein